MMTNLFWKCKGLSKKTASIQELRKYTKIVPVTKNTSKITPYLLALLCATSFYLFEFFPDSSDELRIAYKKQIEAKKKSSVALEKVKKLAEGSKVHSEYLRERSNADKACENLEKIKNQERFFGFRSIKRFMGEFGLVLGLFIYALINLFRSFYFEHKNIGMKFLHGLIISVAMFYFFWMFEYSDFSKITYYLMTLLSAGIVVLAVYLITKYQDHYINRLKDKISRLVAFSFLHTKQEKKPEMLNLFKELSKNH